MSVNEEAGTATVKMQGDELALIGEQSVKAEAAEEPLVKDGTAPIETAAQETTTADASAVESQVAVAETKSKNEAIVKPELIPIQVAPGAAEVKTKIISSPTAETNQSGNPSTKTLPLTPTQVLDEFKRRGHFDALRKSLYTEFASSSDSEVFRSTITDLVTRRTQEDYDQLHFREYHTQQKELKSWLDKGEAYAQLKQRPVGEDKVKGLVAEMWRKEEEEEEGDMDLDED